MADEYIRISDSEAKVMLERLSKLDLRTQSNMTAWLIRQEWARRFSQPNPLVSVADAMAEQAEVAK